MCIYYELSDDHRRTVREIFNYPPPSNLSWSKILSLFREIQNSRPEKVRVDVKHDRVCVAVECIIKEIAIFHRPKNRPCASPSTVNAIKDFLIKLEIDPVE